jgi:hypothetical protein
LSETLISAGLSEDYRVGGCDRLWGEGVWGIMP